MKKHSIIILSLILIFSIGVFKYTENKSKNMSYAIEKYATSGFFNKHKLSIIENYYLAFSDGKIAVVEVTGITKKLPHKKIKYKLFLEKNTREVWKVKRLYTIP
jgi:hypothetical protein